MNPVTKEDRDFLKVLFIKELNSLKPYSIKDIRKAARIHNLAVKLDIPTAMIRRIMQKNIPIKSSYKS